jgi:predicted RNA binding protein with dsRBD fold (UPF0201 family)
MDKVKDAVKKTAQAAEAAKAKEQAVQIQIREMEETVRIVTNIQGLIDNGTFVGRVRKVLDECHDWAGGMAASIQKQVNLLKTPTEGASDGKKEAEPKDDAGKVVELNQPPK